jgi:hypothetical protein
VGKNGKLIPALLQVQESMENTLNQTKAALLKADQILKGATYLQMVAPFNLIHDQTEEIVRHDFAANGVIFLNAFEK